MKKKILAMVLFAVMMLSLAPIANAAVLGPLASLQVQAATADGDDVDQLYSDYTDWAVPTDTAADTTTDGGKRLMGAVTYTGLASNNGTFDVGEVLTITGRYDDLPKIKTNDFLADRPALYRVNLQLTNYEPTDVVNVNGQRMTPDETGAFAIYFEAEKGGNTKNFEVTQRNAAGTWVAAYTFTIIFKDATPAAPAPGPLGPMSSVQAQAVTADGDDVDQLYSDYTDWAVPTDTAADTTTDGGKRLVGDVTYTGLASNNGTFDVGEVLTITGRYDDLPKIKANDFLADRPALYRVNLQLTNYEPTDVVNVNGQRQTPDETGAFAIYFEAEKGGNTKNFEVIQKNAAGTRANSYTFTIVFNDTTAPGTVTVHDGSGSGEYEEGEIVTITANEASTGQSFIGWKIAPSVTFTDETSEVSATAKFIMPAEDVVATAQYLSKADDDAYNETNNITVNLVVDENTHGDFQNQEEKISAVGVGRNGSNGDTFTLKFTKPAGPNAVEIDGTKYRKNEAVQVDISLAGVADPSNLTHPIAITVPIPSGISPENFWILHYHQDGSYEAIRPTLNADGTCSFVVTSFSVFVFVNEAPASGGPSYDHDWSQDLPAVPPPPQQLPTNPAVTAPAPAAPTVNVYRVVARSLNVRSGPGTGYPAVGQLSQNALIQIVGFSEDGLWARTDGGAWLSMAYLSGTGAASGSGDFAVDVRGSLNVRSGPGTGSAVVGKLLPGALVRVLAVNGGWATIEYAGQTAYVSAVYLR